jgi:hypothetical protein
MKSIFFALAPEVAAKHAAYKTGVETLAKTIGFQPIFLEQAPPGQPLVEWVANQLQSCDFAFFDVTTGHPDCLVGYGIALESDVRCYALSDDDGPFARPGRTPSRLLGDVAKYINADGFQRKAREIIERVEGATEIQKRQLIEKIKQRVAKMQPVPLRDIAHELGVPPAELRPIVYSLVAESVLAKEGETRWTKYRLPPTAS